MTKRDIRCLRPPYGAYDDGVVERLSARGLHTVLWTVDPQDWARPGTDAIVRRTMDQLRPSAVILLHDGGGDRSQTVAALPRILDGLRERGYRVVPLCR